MLFLELLHILGDLEFFSSKRTTNCNDFPFQESKVLWKDHKVNCAINFLAFCISHNILQVVELSVGISSRCSVNHPFQTHLLSSVDSPNHWSK